MREAIVIGAGIGGLASAITLGAHGWKVRVLESASRPGGKAGIELLDGVEVDTGPSVLTMPHVFARLLGMAGMQLDDVLTLRKPDPGFRYLFPDGVALDVHFELEDTLASVRATLGPAAADELRSFLRYAGGIWEAAAPAFVYGPAPKIGSILGGGLRLWSQVAQIDPLSSMWGAVKKRVRSPHLRMLLARYATYNGSDVRQAPATLNCISHVELAQGGYGVEGGMYNLVRALVAAAERVGVTIDTDTRVERVLVTRYGIEGVIVDGGRQLTAPCVVANADVSHLVRDLLPREIDHDLKATSEPSMSAVNVIVKAAAMERAAHTVVFPNDYLQEFADIFDRDRPPQEPTVYVCAQSRCHGREGWPQHEPLFVMANAPAEPELGHRDVSMWRGLETVALARLRSHGILAADDEVLWRRNPRDLARRFEGSRGAIYGAASNSKSAAFQRPANEVETVPGLFLASGTAHPGGGVPMAALSGIAAARAAHARLGARRRATGFATASFG